MKHYLFFLFLLSGLTSFGQDTERDKIRQFVSWPIAVCGLRELRNLATPASDENQALAYLRGAVIHAVD